MSTTNLLTFFTERWKSGFQDFLQKTGATVPPDFETTSSANAAIVFARLTLTELRRLRLDFAVAEVVRPLGPAVAVRLGPETRLAWREIQTVVDGFDPKPEDGCTVLHLEGRQRGGFPGCAARLASKLKENGRKLIVALDGSCWSASTSLITECDFVIATEDSACCYHGGRIDFDYEIKMLPEDRLALPHPRANIADGALSTELNTCCAEQDAKKFLPKFLQRLGSTPMHDFVSNPVFTLPVKQKLQTALAGTSDPDAAFSNFWLSVHADPLFTEISAKELLELGAVDKLL